MMRIYKSTLIFLFFVYATNALAQTKITEGRLEQKENTDAVLELESLNKNKGLLMSTVALVSRVSASPLTKHEEGMFVYNTNTAGTSPNNVSPGLYYNNGFSWLPMSLDITGPVIGDIKHGFYNGDHNGWYLMNGRPITSLSRVAQDNATSINLKGNLHDVSGDILKANSGSQYWGTSGGTNSFTLIKENIPRLATLGTTGSSGAHTHSFTDSGTGASTVRYFQINPFLTPVNTLFHNTTDTQNTGPNIADHHHDFTIISRGGKAPVNFVPRYLTANTFIYLGI